MEKTDEEMIFIIAKSLGAGGRTFTADDVQKVDEWMFEAEMNYALRQMVIDSRIFVGIDNCGKVEFSNDPAKFSKKA